MAVMEGSGGLGVEVMVKVQMVNGGGDGEGW